MNELGLRLGYWVRRLGWPTLIGVVLTICAILFYLTWNAPAEHRMHAMATHVASMRTAVGQRTKSWVPESPRAAIQTFYRALPPEAAIPDLMEKIFDAAYDADLAVENGEFKLLRQKDTAFSRYEIVLPVQGRYADIRKFANRVLQEIPSAALEDISFSREDVKNPEVDAKVRFTLYLGTHP